MKRMVLILTALAGCRDTSKIEARVGELEHRVDALLAESMVAARAKTDDTSKGVVDEVGSIGRQVGEHESRLARLESYAELTGTIAKPFGWWCSESGSCGRTLGECVALEKRLVYMGSRPPSSCKQTKTAWCAPLSVECQSAPCAECVESP